MRIRTRSLRSLGVTLAVLVLVALASCTSESRITAGPRSSTERTTEPSTDVSTKGSTGSSTEVSTATSTEASTETSTATSTGSTLATLPPITGSTARPTTTLESATSGPTDPVAAAGAAYLALAEESNTARNALWEPYPDGVPWSKFPAMCAQMEQIETTLSTGLRAYSAWPAAVSADIETMATTLDEIIGLYQQCSTTAGDNVDALTAIDQNLLDAQDRLVPAVDNVRSKLGLPPAERS